MPKKYPKQRSTATVTFTDGEVVSYEVSAGAGIAGYLMREASDTGILTLRDDDAGAATCIPLDRIRDIQLAPAQTTTEETD